MRLGSSRQGAWFLVGLRNQGAFRSSSSCVPGNGSKKLKPDHRAPLIHYHTAAWWWLQPDVGTDCQPPPSPLHECCASRDPAWRFVRVAAMPEPGMLQHGGSCGPHVGLLLQAGPHKVLPLGRVPRREVQLVAVHDQRGCLDLHLTYDWLCRLLAMVLMTERPSEMRLHATGASKIAAAVLHIPAKSG